jgi:membrane-associated protein
MMPLEYFIDFIIHLDKYLTMIIQTFGPWTYAILFFVIFIETGLVVTPFLPGDSLLFVSGAFSALGTLNIGILALTLSFAAVIGDTVNYWIGNYLGPKVFTKRNSRFFKKEYLDRAHKFYEKHGGKTIVIARFIPIIRTFAPFVAGAAKMGYKRFISYNIVGGIAWVAIFLAAGYNFGNIPIIQENLSLLIIGIIAISFVPPIIELVRHKMRNRSASAGEKQ